MANKDFVTNIKRTPTHGVSGSAAANDPEPAAAKPAAKKMGRPSTRKEGENYVSINFKVPESLKAKIDIAKISANGNMAAYITRLIERDIEENMNDYIAFQNKFNS